MWGCLVVLLGLLSLPPGSLADEGAKPLPPGLGMLTGYVTMGPVSPVGRLGLPPAPRPAAGVTLVVYGPAREEVAAVTTDANGQFRVNLLPGNYQLEMAPRTDRKFSKDLPATVTISQGQKTHLDVRLDTRMR
jgi:hypothetical protein